MAFLGLGDGTWEILSYAGFLLLLGPFALHGLGRMRRGDAYFGANLAGSVVLALYSAKLGSPALTALEASWAAAAVAGWARSRRRTA